MVIFIGIMAIPIVLLLLPAEYFDKGQTICPSVLLLHRTCPGCGLTRGIQHLIHFDFNAAWNFNKMCVLVLPILVFVWVKELRLLYKKINA